VGLLTKHYCNYSSEQEDMAAAAELRARHDRDAMEETLPEELQHPPVPDCGPLPLLGVK